jgi:hypothetical protein
MKKPLRLLMALVSIFTLVTVTQVNGQAPPPPSHSQNGNQASPGGTGCPVDNTGGIILAMIISLAYAGFILYERSKKPVAR